MLGVGHLAGEHMGCTERKVSGHTKRRCSRRTARTCVGFWEDCALLAGGAGKPACLGAAYIDDVMLTTKVAEAELQIEEEVEIKWTTSALSYGSSLGLRLKGSRGRNRL